MNETDRPGASAPPVAEARPSSYTAHGITVEDPYRWLRDDGFPTVDDAAVLAYLKAENDYFEAVMAPRRALVETLYAELKAREQPDDADVPIKDGPFYYHARFEAGGQYRIREPRVVSARRTGHEYHVDHQGDRFVIKTNDTHKNARLVTAPDDDPSESTWQTLVAGSDQRYIRHFAAFADFIAVQERLDGLDQIRLIDRAGTSFLVRFTESSYSVEIGANKEFQARTVRLHYTSLVTPNTVFDCDLETGALRERKVQRIPSGYDPSSYVTERAMAPARDGVRVPVSIVYRKGTPRDGTAPLYLYGYGAYGNAVPPFFSPSRLSLLDRGMIFAIAHVRGGDELGRHWYESGKLDRRTNTFNDFVDIARHLIAEGLTAPGRIASAGRSAGGELVGAAVNQAPGLWGAAVAHVPFVDVLNTMLDTSLALTPSEWSEWGNPIEDKEAFELIRSYSPYDQLKAGRYPAMFVTGSLHDWRVTYWEPAKYVAKLRTLKEDDNPLVLKTNMGAGHGGASGRFDALYEVAEEYAFVLWALRTSFHSFQATTLSIA